MIPLVNPAVALLVTGSLMAGGVLLGSAPAAAAPVQTCAALQASPLTLSGSGVVTLTHSPGDVLSVISYAKSGTATLTVRFAPADTRSAGSASSMSYTYQTTGTTAVQFSLSPTGGDVIFSCTPGAPLQPLPTPVITATPGPLARESFTGLLTRTYTVTVDRATIPPDATLAFTKDGVAATPGSFNVACASTVTFGATLSRPGVPSTSADTTVSPQCFIPSAPTLTAAPGDRSIALSWNGPAAGQDPIDSYILTVDGVPQTIPGTQTSQNLTGLVNGKSYSFTLVAINVAGSSRPPATATATPAPIAPPKPDLTGARISGTSVTVDYTLGTPRTVWTTMEYQWRIAGGTWSSSGTIASPTDSGQFSVTATGLSSPQGVEVRARSVNDSKLSDWASVTAPAVAPAFSYAPATGREGQVLTVSPTFTGPVSIPSAGAVFTATGLPPGLQIRKDTGLIVGNPAGAFSGSVAVTLTVPGGATSGAIARLSIATDPSARQVIYPAISGIQGSPLAPVKPWRGSNAPTGCYVSPDLATAAPGLVLFANSGAIAGTPTAAGSTPVTIQLSERASGDPTCQTPGKVLQTMRTTVTISPNPRFGGLELRYNGATSASIHALVGSAVSVTPVIYPPGQTGATFRITSGVLPAGLFIDPVNGTISGIPTAITPRSDLTIVVDQSAAGSPTGVARSALATVSIDVAPAGTTQVLSYPDASVTVGQSLTVAPSGIGAGVTYALSSHPPGMTIDPLTGQISWKPTTAQVGTATVVVTETGAGLAPVTTTFTVTVKRAPAATTGSSTSAPTGTSRPGGGTPGSGIPANASQMGALDPCRAADGSLFANMVGYVGSSFAMDPNGAGFTTPVKYEVTDGALPEGITLDGELGLVSGTPARANNGIGPVTITATWADGTARSYPLNFIVIDPQHSFTYPTLPIASTGTGLKVSPSTFGSLGTAKYTLVCGSLPAGTKLDPRTGVISGKPTEVNLDPVPLRIRQSTKFGNVDASLVLPVTNWGLSWLVYPTDPHLQYKKAAAVAPTRVILPKGTRYVLAHGSLPAGMKLNTKTGAIAGRPTKLSSRPSTAFVSAKYQGTAIAFTAVTISVGKAKAPMAAVGVAASPVSASGAKVVAGVRHANWAPLSAKVTCSGCSYTFNPRSGALSVSRLTPGSTVTVAITSRPAGAAASLYVARTWKHVWRVAR